MSVLKSEVKIATTQEIGVRMDDLLDEAQGEVHRAMGGQSALMEAVKQVQLLHGHVDKDIDESKYDLDVGSKIKLYVTRAVTILESMSQQLSNVQFTKRGKVEALQRVVHQIKSIQDAEKTKLESLQTVPPENQLANKERVIGQHPGQSLKDLRLAESTKNVTAPAITPPKQRNRKEKTNGRHA